jgi:DNA-binding MarR family transcriptional regulator
MSATAPASTSPQTEREGLARELLPQLMGLKSWLRRVGRWQLSEQALASLSVLAVLDRCGPSRVSGLAELAHVDPSTVSRQIKALCDDGLVVRGVDPDDGRAQQLDLTDAGRAVLQASQDRMVDIVARRLQAWTVDELRDLIAQLHRLIHDIDSEPDPA